MALLSQLEYYGIRSVPGSSKDSHHIKFETPLTIISGPNGSGKTTLIEALKYVTANESPPGDKQAFVHNLHIARCPRVDGLIRLEFLTEKDKKVTVTKRFNAAKNARTKGGVQFKSDESTIKVYDDNGQQQSISSKTTDFQKEVLNHLGVPAAILSNVIFCHQEDSCWPLSEPKELKQRFDKIFQLQKFTKAIEQAKKIKKDQMAQLKCVNAECRRAKGEVAHKGTNLRIKEVCKKDQIEINKQIKAINQYVQETAVKMRKMEGDIRVLEENSNQKVIATAEIKLLKDEIRRMENQGVRQYSGSEEALQEEIALVIKQLNSDEQKQCINDLEATEVSLEKKRTQRDQYQYKLDELISNKKSYEYEQGNLKNCEQDIVKRFPDLPSQNVSEYISPFLAQRRKLLDEAKVVHNNAKLTFREECDVAVSEQSRAKAELDSLQENKERLLKEATLLEKRCALIDGSDKKELKINHRLTELNLMLQGLPPIDDDQFRDIQQKRKQLREEIEKLRTESLVISKLEERSKDRKRIESQLSISQEKYRQLMNKHADSMKALFGYVPQDKWGGKVSKKKDEIDAQLRKNSEGISKVDLSLNSEKTMEAEKREEKEQLVTQIELLKKSVENNGKCEISQLKNEMTNISKELRLARKELAPLNTKADLYEVWMNETEKKSCCPLCERKFTGKQGAQSLVEKLHNMSITLPDDIAQLTDKVSQLEARENVMAKCLTDLEKLKELEASLEDCQKRMSLAKQRQQEFEAVLGKLKDEDSSVKKHSDMVSRIIADISLIDSLTTTIEQLTQQLSSLPNSDQALTSSEDLLSQITAKEKRLKELERELDNVDFRKQKRNEIDTETIDLRRELVELSENCAQKANLQEQIVNKKTEISELDQRYKSIFDQLPSLAQKISVCRKRRDESEDDFNKRERDGEYELTELQNSQQNLERYKKRLEHLKVSDEELDELEKQIRKLDIEINDLLLQKGKCESNTSDYTRLNNKHRSLQRQLDRFILSGKIENLEQKLASFGDCDEELQKINNEYRKLRFSKSEEDKNMSCLEGRLMETEKKLKEVRAALKTEEMEKAEVNYRKWLVTQSVTEKIIEDLESFVTVLDTSILKFHKDKMAAINIILDDLWRRVYNGVDIETIKIKTEKNESGDKRASYDYNVIMVLEGGVEVGMRDRCSAGQKMLASLLIRIALADVFAKTCSIIALDEPTTNLDTLKIEQMAAMLNALINTRRADDNYGNVQGKQFQMIVITHDDRLVDALKLGCRPNKTFKISKDPLSGKSRLNAYDSAGNIVD